MPREIVEDQLYTDQINKYRISWKRLDEALMTLYPALLGSPELFPLVPGTKTPPPKTSWLSRRPAALHIPNPYTQSSHP